MLMKLHPKHHLSSLRTIVLFDYNPSSWVVFFFRALCVEVKKEVSHISQLIITFSQKYSFVNKHFVINTN